jgi:hypothetical protein
VEQRYLVWFGGGGFGAVVVVVVMVIDPMYGSGRMLVTKKKAAPLSWLTGCFLKPKAPKNFTANILGGGSAGRKKAHP